MQFKQLLSSRTKLKSRLRIRCLQRLKLPSNDWDLISPGNPFPPTLVPNRWVNSWQPKSGWLLDLLLTTLSRELLYRHYFGKEASYLSDQCFVSTWTSVSMRCWLRGNFQIWLISYTLHTICSVSMLHCVYQWCRRPRANPLSFALFFYTQHDRRSVLADASVFHIAHFVVPQTQVSPLAYLGLLDLLKNCILFPRRVDCRLLCLIHLVPLRNISLIRAKNIYNLLGVHSSHFVNNIFW